MTAKAQDMTESLEKSELPERKAYVETFIREIVVMPGKAIVHYKVPTAKDSQSPDGDAEELDLAGSLNPNPPKDTDGRREDSGRGVRELPGR